MATLSGSIYRDYDQAALDDQYTARPRIPDYDSYLERWPRESAAARAERRDDKTALWDVTIRRQETLDALKPNARADTGDQIIQTAPMRPSNMIELPNRQ